MDDEHEEMLMLTPWKPIKITFHSGVRKHADRRKQVNEGRPILTCVPRCLS